MAVASKKTGKKPGRSFKGIEIANTDFEFMGLGNLKAEVIIDNKAPNPHFNPRYAGAPGNPEHVTVARNVRESPIALMASKGHLEKHQLEAASRFRGYWEALGGAGAGAFDYSKEPVDGGGIREAISDRQVNASVVLRKCQEALGPRHYDIVCRVAGEGRTIYELGSSKRERTTLADYLKHALDDLAVHWGIQRRK